MENDIFVEQIAFFIKLMLIYFFDFDKFTTDEHMKFALISSSSIFFCETFDPLNERKRKFNKAPWLKYLAQEERPQSVLLTQIYLSTHKRSNLSGVSVLFKPLS